MSCEDVRRQIDEFLADPDNSQKKSSLIIVTYGHIVKKDGLLNWTVACAGCYGYRQVPEIQNATQ